MSGDMGGGSRARTVLAQCKRASGRGVASISAGSSSAVRYDSLPSRSTLCSAGPSAASASLARDGLGHAPGRVGVRALPMADDGGTASMAGGVCALREEKGRLRAWTDPPGAYTLPTGQEGAFLVADSEQTRKTEGISVGSTCIEPSTNTPRPYQSRVPPFSAPAQRRFLTARSTLSAK